MFLASVIIVLMTKVKVIDLLGKPLKPDTKYLFALDGTKINHLQTEHLRNELVRLLGHDNFALVYTQGDPRKVVSAYNISMDIQIPESNSTKRENQFVPMPAPSDFSFIPPQSRPNSELSANEA